MSKRTIIWVIIAILVLTGLVLVNFGRNLPLFPFSDPVFTERIPTDRPKRLDRKLMDRFSGVKMHQILETLTAEKAAATAANPTAAATPHPSTEERLLASLPDEPLPYSPEAVAKDETWLKSFITTFQQAPNQNPSDKDLWKFNLALSALKIDAEQLPESLRLETKPVPESDTFAVRLESRDIDLTGPFCFGDFNGDGKIEFVTGGGISAHSIETSGKLKPTSWETNHPPGNGLYPADYDADGDLDLFVTRSDGLPNSLLRNKGNGEFEEVATETGLLSFNDTIVAGWLDYDNDGSLDLIVGSADHPLELYRQTKVGTFQPIAWDLKLWIPRGAHHLEIVDFNGDQHPDFFLGIDGLADRLYQNVPALTWSEWRFTDIAPKIGLPKSKAASPAVFFDFDNDRIPDLVSGIAATPGSADPGSAASSGIQFYHNEGNGTFRNLTSDIGLRAIPKVTTLAALDLDNDGYLDLAVGTEALSLNRIYWNQGGTGLREVSVTSRGSFIDDPAQMHASDLNADGHADLIYRNGAEKLRWLQSSGPIENYLRVVLPNHEPGTRISLVTRDHDWILHSIERTLEQEPSVTIGLGDAAVIETLEIILPDGKKLGQTLTGLKPNQDIVIELSGSAEIGTQPTTGNAP